MALHLSEYHPWPGDPAQIEQPDKRESKRTASHLWTAKLAKAKPSELSGGMRQRAALIRTLVLDPDLLLLDEPFSALDYQTRLTVGDDIGQIIRKEKKTAILVTHDLSEAVSLGDRVIVLSAVPPLFNRRSRFTLICRKILLFFAEIHRNLKHISILSGGN